MADENTYGAIPDGWILKKEFHEDGSKFSHYFCPATGQLFLTYEDLMHYVDYAKVAKVSIYSPNFEATKRKKKAGSSFRKKHLLGQSSKSLAVHQSKVLSARRKRLLGQSSKLSARKRHLLGQSSKSLTVHKSKVLSARRKRLLGQSSKLSAVDHGKTTGILLFIIGFIELG